MNWGIKLTSLHPSQTPQEKLPSNFKKSSLVRVKDPSDVQKDLFTIILSADCIEFSSSSQRHDAFPESSDFINFSKNFAYFKHWADCN